MKIIISQEQFTKLTESELKEAVGVPEHIVSTAINIYDKMVSKLEKENKPLKEIENEKLTLTGQFPIGDIVVKKINIDFNFEKMPKGSEREWISAAHYSLSKLLPKLVFKTANKKTEINMGFRIALNEKDKNKDFITFLKNSRNSLIPTVAHEIQHAYFEKKSQYEPLKKRADYQALSKFNIPFIKPINEFIFNSYYIHAIENIVRPTELAAHMELQGITRKDFLDFFMNSDIVKVLKEAREFTYQNLRDDLIAYTDVIKSILTMAGINPDGMSDNELVDEMLRLTLINLSNTKGDIMKQILTTHTIEIIFGFTGEKHEFFKKYIKYVTKSGDNYESFFKSEEKNFHQVSNEMIKKLSKLYSIAKEN